MVFFSFLPGATAMPGVDQPLYTKGIGTTPQPAEQEARKSWKLDDFSSTRVSPRLPAPGLLTRGQTSLHVPLPLWWGFCYVAASYSRCEERGRKYTTRLARCRMQYGSPRLRRGSFEPPPASDGAAGLL